MMNPTTPIRAVLFDFGGVLAEEGFREGLAAIAAANGLDPAYLQNAGMDAVYDSGYVTGTGTEADFWKLLKKRTGILGENAQLAREIQARFILRPRMIELVRSLRRKGILAAILSDQTDWLERLDARDDFFREFDRIYNSYRLGKGKRDPSVFDDVVRDLGLAPEEAIFVDDSPRNIETATARGLAAILFRDVESCIEELERKLGFRSAA